MSAVFRFPTPVIQAIGLVAVPTSDRIDAAAIERKPVAAAVLTMSQRDDGLVTLFHEVVTAIDELQFPLPWLIEQELIAGAPTLVSPEDVALLVADAAQQRHFVEAKLPHLTCGDHRAMVSAFAAAEVDEAGLCRRLDIPLLDLAPAEAARVWMWYPRESRIATLGQHALGRAVSRLILWANLSATMSREPGWFYETVLALRCWLDERETDAPELYRWGTSRPVMRAVSFVEDYRRDLANRQAGQPSDWPTFEPGLFHS